MSENPYALDANIAKYLFGHQVEYHWIYRVGQEWKHLPCNEPKPVDNTVDRPYLTTGERVPYYMSSQPLLLLHDLAAHNFFIELHYAGHGWRLRVYKESMWGKIDPHASTDAFGKTIEDVLLDAMTKLVEQAKIYNTGNPCTSVTGGYNGQQGLGNHVTDREEQEERDVCTNTS